jgi:hypothetical protein
MILNKYPSLIFRKKRINSPVIVTPPVLNTPLPNGVSTIESSISGWFDQTGRYTFNPDSNYNLPNSNWFFAFWVKIDFAPDSGANAQYIMSNGLTGTGKFDVYIDSRRLWVNFNTQGAQRLLNAGNVVADGQWRLIVIQRDGSNYVSKTCIANSSTVTTMFTLAHTDTTVTTLLSPIQIGCRSNLSPKSYYYNHIGWFAKGDGLLTDSQIVSICAGISINTLTGFTLKALTKITGNTTEFDGINGIVATKTGNVYPRGSQAYTGQPITLTTNNSNFSIGRVYQREKGTTSKTITFSGTYTGSPTGIEVRIIQNNSEIITWTRASTPTVGTWTISLNVPQGFNYILEARHIDNPSNVCRSMWHWGVGIVGIWAGQSNSQLWFAQTDTSISVSGSEFVKMGIMANAAQPMVDVRLFRYAGLYRVGKRLPEELGVPVMMVNGATGGSGLIYGWDNPTSSFYQTFLTMLNNAGGDCEFIPWLQGEADAAQIVTTRALYGNSLVTCFNNMRASIGRLPSELPIFCAILGRKNTPETNDKWGMVRAGLMDGIDNCPNTKHMGGYFDLTKIDDLHLNNIGYGNMGNRLVQALCYNYNDASFTNGMYAPEPVSANITGNDINVLFTLNDNTQIRGLLGSMALTGFVVKNDTGVVQSITSTTITGTNTVVLSMSTQPTSGWTVEYLSSAVIDTSNLVYGNGTVDGITTVQTLPALPTRSPIIL